MKRIKVCGLRDGENIYNIEQLDVDFIGLIFYRRSPRCIYETPDYLPRDTGRVGVFVNESLMNMKIISNQFLLDHVQLHGDESPDVCLAMRISGQGVIKSFPVATEKDLEKTKEYEGSCDYFLFDTKCETYGGSGKPFDWNILQSYNGKTPFFLGGGIGPDSVEALKLFDHPQLFGYDLNSRFEIRPGLKDVKKIARFIKQIRAHEQNKSTTEQ
ncbi:MAG: phosphoribosylanthranilate isomerase [Mediterranea sp.]|jgi:phosphoribosylanthranilate isomerase|nr:phosphoribosylanthranilate isomerase [Mediterranea sp.]